MWKEFKEFAVKGNVIDLAVGVIVGGAFGKIVTSLVQDIIMPIFGLILGGIDISKWGFYFGKTVIGYGQFIQNVIDFLIISFSIFLFIKLINKFKKKQEIQEEKQPSKEELLLMEIRDLLKNK